MLPDEVNVNNFIYGYVKLGELQTENKEIAQLHEFGWKLHLIIFSINIELWKSKSSHTLTNIYVQIPLKFPRNSREPTPNFCATSSLDLLCHNLNSPRGSYVVSSTLSERYVVQLFFKVKQRIPPKSIPFKHHIETIAKRFVVNIDYEFLCCCPSNSNPNENAEYIVNKLKNLLITYFLIRHTNLTRRVYIPQGTPKA